MSKPSGTDRPSANVPAASSAKKRLFDNIMRLIVLLLAIGAVYLIIETMRPAMLQLAASGDKALPGSSSTTRVEDISGEISADGANTPKASKNITGLSFRQAPQREVLAILPQTKTRPIVLAFKTKFCKDCQAFAPMLAKMKTTYPGIEQVILDVQTDREAHNNIFSAFKPVTVPLVLFIGAGGLIYDHYAAVPTEAQLNMTFDTLSKLRPVSPEQVEGKIPEYQLKSPNQSGPESSAAAPKRLHAQRLAAG